MPVLTFEHMRAMEVVDQHDELVGLVDDVVVDLEASDIYYVVVQPAGVLEDRLRLPRDAATISRMPRVAPDQPGFGSKEYEAKIFGYWGVAR